MTSTNDHRMAAEFPAGAMVRQADDSAHAHLTIRQAITVFLVVATLTANAVSILFVLGRFTAWESWITLFTVLVISAGMIYTILWVSQRGSKASRLG